MLFQLLLVKRQLNRYKTEPSNKIVKIKRNMNKTNLLWETSPVQRSCDQRSSRPNAQLNHTDNKDPEKISIAEPTEIKDRNCGPRPAIRPQQKSPSSSYILIENFNGGCLLSLSYEAVPKFYTSI